MIFHSVKRIVFFFFAQNYWLWLFLANNSLAFHEKSLDFSRTQRVITPLAFFAKNRRGFFIFTLGEESCYRKISKIVAGFERRVAGFCRRICRLFAKNRWLLVEERLALSKERLAFSEDSLAFGYIRFSCF